ncbi:KR domain-containing protein [Streptomyces cyaneofuscatus]|uniref:KR domain-containing protein n=1 Tax=Streptomyces cyaneofuscatus TaxID=66883 RepID=UPI0033F1CE0B
MVDLRPTRAGWDSQAVYELVGATTRLIGDRAAAGRGEGLRIALVTVGGRAHDDSARAHIGALQGYVQSVNAEAGAPVLVYCDLDAVVEANVALPARELVAYAPAPAVAYRAGTRTERALSPAPRDPAGVAAEIKEGGRYIVTGGLGGVGRELSRFLAEKYGARLVLVGSTPAPHLDESRLARYTALKVRGMAALAGELAKDALLVGFSSVNAYFGGAGYTEHSASNSALNAAVQGLREQGYRRAMSLGWSAWSGTGMSGGAGGSLPAERRGFLSLDVDLALESVDVAVRRNQPVTYIGLDGAHPDVASHVRHKPGWELVSRYFYAARLREQGPPPGPVSRSTPRRPSPRSPGFSAS